MQSVTDISQLGTAINDNGKMVISKDKNKMIIMNMEEYRSKIFEKNIQKHLIKAEEDISEGRVKDAVGVFEKWKGDYEI